MTGVSLPLFYAIAGGGKSVPLTDPQLKPIRTQTSRLYAAHTNAGVAYTPQQQQQLLQERLKPASPTAATASLLLSDSESTTPARPGRIHGPASRAVDLQVRLQPGTPSLLLQPGTPSICIILDDDGGECSKGDASIHIPGQVEGGVLGLAGCAAKERPAYTYQARGGAKGLQGG